MPKSLKGVVAATATLALWTGTMMGASGQDAHAQAPPTPAPSAAPPGSATVATVAAPTASIATPGAGAAPNKVEDAKQVAKVAELTPILPNPKDPSRPAFQLYAEVDIPVLGVGLVFAAARLIHVQKAFCAPLCDPSELNALDKTTAGFWSPAWSTASDFGLYGVALGAAALLIADEGFVDALNDAVVVAESALSATAVSSVLTLAAGRPRPFLYGEAAPLADRNSSDASLSFLSSHSSVAFGIATSTFMASRRLHPSSKVPFLVLGLGLAASSFVGTARVMAGRHFISDAVGGAIVGGSMGVLIPALHSSPVKVVPVVSDTHRGFMFAGTF